VIQAIRLYEKRSHGGTNGANGSNSSTNLTNKDTVQSTLKVSQLLELLKPKGGPKLEQKKPKIEQKKPKIGRGKEAEAEPERLKAAQEAKKLLEGERLKAAQEATKIAEQDAIEAKRLAAEEQESLKIAKAIGEEAEKLKIAQEEKLKAEVKAAELGREKMAIEEEVKRRAKERLCPFCDRVFSSPAGLYGHKTHCKGNVSNLNALKVQNEKEKEKEKEKKGKEATKPSPRTTRQSASIKPPVGKPKPVGNPGSRIKKRSNKMTLGKRPLGKSDAESGEMAMEPNLLKRPKRSLPKDVDHALCLAIERNDPDGAKDILKDAGDSGSPSSEAGANPIPTPNPTFILI